MTATMSEKGRAGRQASEGIAELWDIADALNRNYAVAGAEWVPIRSIVIDDSLTPRHELNTDAIEAYRGSSDSLPPIKVQKDTFVLIDGRHRLEAYIGLSDHIPVIELDVDDYDLFRTAVRENRAHGVILTTKERERAGRRLIAERPSLTDHEIAEDVGVSVHTVARWRKELAAPKPEREPAAETKRKPAAETKRKVRASLDWMDEAIADFTQGAEATADAVDPDALEGHLAQAERFVGYAGQAVVWAEAYAAALRRRIGL